jgi:hypothetical protein
MACFVHIVTSFAIMIMIAAGGAITTQNTDHPGSFTLATDR